MKKRFVSCLMTFLLIICCCDISVSATSSSVPTVTYKAHVQNIGWMSTVGAGETAGTTGNGYRMEALKINLTDNGNSMIKYRAHVQNIGWQDWVYSGSIVGTTGISYRIEALEIKLRTAYVNDYDIYYRVHVADFGWLGWAKNGATAGSTGIGAQIEAVQIKLVEKGTIVSTSSATASVAPTLSYKSHVADIGWMSTVNQEQVSGTIGQAKRLEAFIINLTDPYGGSNIQYKAHVADIGWQDWKSSSNIAGTTGQAKAVEAIQVKLTGSLEVYYDIYYRVHTSNIGWLGWAKNGATAGTTGGSLPVEAIQIKIVPKGTSVDVGGTAYYDKSSTVSSTTSTTWQMPMKNYTVTQKFGNFYAAKQMYHCGIDMSSTNTDIYAASDGIVVYKGGNKSNGNGYHIVLSHTINGTTVYSLYAHLSSYSSCPLVGSSVSVGQKIGVMGNTGNSTGSHLHFAIYDKTSTDPYGYSYNAVDNYKTSRNGYTFFDPNYIIKYNKLP